MVFDGQNGAANRRSLLPDYKPARPGDEEVFADLPHIYRGLDLLDIGRIEHDRWEADDVIASSSVPSHGASTSSCPPTRTSTSSCPRACPCSTPNGAPTARHIHPAEVLDRHHVAPHQWCDYRALTGDKSDNIPGIGEKTASRLLANGAHLEDLDKLDRLSRTGHQIRHQWGDLLLWRTLTDLPCPPPANPISPHPRGTGHRRPARPVGVTATKPSR